MSHGRAILEPLKASIIEDIRQFFASYDEDYLMNQHEVIRYIMFKVNLKIDEVKDEEKTVESKRTEEAKVRQEYFWNSRVSQVFASYGELLRIEIQEADKRNDDKAKEELNKFNIGFQRVKNNHNIIRYSERVYFRDAERREFEQAEIQAYRDALRDACVTANGLTNFSQSIKDDFFAYTHKLESQEARISHCRLFHKKPFDYKRHTINLKKTQELFEKPWDATIQREYRKLIVSNKHDNDTKGILTCLAIGAILLVGFIITSALLPPTVPFLAFGIGLAVSGLLTGGSVTAYIAQGIEQRTHTSNHMSYLFHRTMHFMTQKTHPLLQSHAKSHGKPGVIV